MLDYIFLTGAMFFGSSLIWLTRFTFSAWLATLLVLSMSFALLGAVYGKVLRSGSSPFLIAGIWTLYEILRGMGRLGFPWLDMVYSQYALPFLNQTASLWGATGITFLIVALNWVLARLISKKKIQIADRYILLLIIFHILFGLVRSFQGEEKVMEPIRVAVIQGNFADKEDWEFFPLQVKKTLFDMTARAVRDHHPHIIVYTETVVLDALNRSRRLREEFQAMAGDHQTALLVGSPDLSDNKVFNGVYLITADTVAIYRKQHLVPVGERIPFVDVFPKLKTLIPRHGHYHEGYPFKIFSFRDTPFNVLICFESFFSEIQRRGVMAGSTFSVNVTNDVWSGSEMAHVQHFAALPVRAIEYHRPIVRAGNDGISAIIDAKGRIIKELPMQVRDILYAEIYPTLKKTLYYSISEYVPAFVLMVIVISYYSDRRKAKNHGG